MKIELSHDSTGNAPTGLNFGGSPGPSADGLITPPGTALSTPNLPILKMDGFAIKHEQSNIPAPDRPLSPSALKPWRLQSIVGQVKEEQQVIATLSKPKPGEWFQTFPDRACWVECYVYKRAGQGRDSIYIVAPEISEKMNDCIKRMQIVPWCNVDDVVGFWPLAIPEAGQTMAWHTSAAAIAESGRSTWQRMVADTKNGFYRSAVAENPRPSPKWPDQQVLDNLLESAVRNCFIDSEAHAVFLEYAMR